MTASPGQLGTHSVQKAASTAAMEKGILKDHLDCQAGWGKKRQQDDHVSFQLTWPDINCASKLCFGGRTRHLIGKEAALTDGWLSRHVTPRIAESFGPAVGATLARPLLWACNDPKVCDRVCAPIRH